MRKVRKGKKTHWRKGWLVVTDPEVKGNFETPQGKWPPNRITIVTKKKKIPNPCSCLERAQGGKLKDRDMGQKWNKKKKDPHDRWKEKS